MYYFFHKVKAQTESMSTNVLLGVFFIEISVKPDVCQYLCVTLKNYFIAHSQNKIKGVPMDVSFGVLLIQ